MSVRILREGMTGDDVKAVQEALNLYKLGTKPLKTDGKFGPLTKSALIGFQRLKKLSPDGAFGPDTMGALYPFGVGRLQVGISKSIGPAQAANKGTVNPASHPVGPVTTNKFDTVHHPLPAPLLSTLPLPPQPSQTAQKFQVKAGEQMSIPFNQSPAPSKPTPIAFTGTLDLIGMIYTPKLVKLGHLSGPGTLGIDLSLGFPETSSAKFTASALWAVTLAPDLFKVGRFDLLSLSAKVGAGMVGQGSQPPAYASLSDSLALVMSYDLVKPIPGVGAPGVPVLKLYLQGGFSASLDHRDSQFHLTTTLPLSLGIQGNF